MQPCFVASETARSSDFRSGSVESWWPFEKKGGNGKSKCGGAWRRGWGDKQRRPCIFFCRSYLILSGVSTAGGSGGAQQAHHAGCVYSITITTISIGWRESKVHVETGRVFLTFKRMRVRRCYSHQKPLLSLPLLLPPRLGRSIVSACLFSSSPSGSKPPSARLSCDFSVGVCVGGDGGGPCWEIHTSSPHGAASSATQRQRTAEAERNRRQAPRCHARDTYYGFTHVRTHAG